MIAMNLVKLKTSRNWSRYIMNYTKWLTDRQTMQQAAGHRQNVLVHGRFERQFDLFECVCGSANENRAIKLVESPPSKGFFWVHENG